MCTETKGPCWLGTSRVTEEVFTIHTFLHHREESAVVIKEPPAGAVSAARKMLFQFAINYFILPLRVLPNHRIVLSKV